MKNLRSTWVFFLAVFIQGIDCNANILAKFHQTGYKVKDARIQLMSYNKDLASSFEIKAFKYNRTTTAHNGSFCLKVDMGDKLETVVQANKFLSNEYRHFPIRFQINVKKSVDGNAIGLGSLKKCGNLTDFYLRKDIIYHACYFVIDETCFPPGIPDGKYRIDLKVIFLKETLALIYMFGEVYTPMSYPKK